MHNHFIVLAVAALALASCAPRESVYESYDTEYEQSEKVYNALLLELENGATVELTQESIESIPPYVQWEQVPWAAEDRAEAFLWNVGSVQLMPTHRLRNATAVVLARLRGSDAWIDLFYVPMDYATHDADGRENLVMTNKNVVGIFVSDKKLHIDVADNDGAGSGEGTMTRFTLDDGWRYGGCFYFGSVTLEEPNEFGLYYDPFGQEKLSREECLL